MKIVLSTSPHIKHSSVLESDFKPRNDLMYTFAPLGILMLCATLREKLQITPEIYDINSCINSDEIKNSDEFYDSAADSILKTKPDVLGFMTECDSYHHVLQICKKVKERKPDCYIIMGGPHATAVATITMQSWNCIDCIVLGEGEITFVELIKSLLQNDKRIIPGTVMRTEAGIPVEGDKRELVDSLDLLPFPAYDLYQPLPGEELFIEAGRGCPFKCTFCSTSPFWQRKHRVKSPQRIVSEIKYIRGFHEVNRIHFTHDLFTTNQAWVEEVCQALIKSSANVKWTCSSRIDTISEPLIALMAQAGCNAIFFGIESGSERVLKIIDKNIPFGKTCEIVSLCYKYGISPNGGLILGFPFEDTQSFKDTFGAYLQLLKLGTKPIHIFSYCPFAQSSLYKSLGEMECSGNFLDIPLPDSLDSQNRELIKSDRQLYGSYFRPYLESAVNGLKSGMIYAVDEFVLLVDAVRIPSILIAEDVGGMDKLFFKWVAYISGKNEKKGKKEFRKYFGNPLDFCEFLLGLCEERKETLEIYTESLLRVISKNFEVSHSLSHREPTTMANYRSKIIARSLTEIKYESKVTSENVIDSMQLEYNIIPILYSAALPEKYIPAKEKTNLIWQKGDSGNISLIQVNDFIYHIASNKNSKEFSVQELVDNWIQTRKEDDELDFSELFENLQTAQVKNIVTVK